MPDGGIFGRDALQVGPILVYGIHVNVNRPVGRISLEIRELDGREPFRKTNEYVRNGMRSIVLIYYHN